MDMDFLKQIIYIVVTTCGTALVGFICTLLKTKITELATNIKSDKAQEYIDLASDAVLDAVQSVAQTYVDTLKKKGEWTEEAGVAAKNMALSILETTITTDAKQVIDDFYGDYTTWVSNKIESIIDEKKE